MNASIQKPMGGTPPFLLRLAARSKPLRLGSQLGYWILVLSLSLPFVSQRGHAEGGVASEVRVPSFVLSGETDRAQAKVSTVASLRLADLVIVSGGYTAGYRPGMLCAVHWDGDPVAEILLVEVRDRISAAIIREMIPGQVIQPGDAVQIKTVHF